MEVNPKSSTGDEGVTPFADSDSTTTTRTPESEPRFVLHLYVAGTNARSLRAVQTVSGLCERYLADRYDLRVIDIYQDPALAAEGEVVAAPTLVKQLPEPLRRVIGDLADEGRVLLALGVQEG
jgi:circadian clock protein KaiB